MSLFDLLRENQKLLNKILESEKDKELKSNFIKSYYKYYKHEVKTLENGCSLEKLEKHFKNGKKTLTTTKHIEDKKFINIETVHNNGASENEDQFVNCTGDDFINQWNTLNTV